MQRSSITLSLPKQSLSSARIGSLSQGRYGFLQTRGYAAPPKPTGNTDVSKLDADLWKSYNTGLRNFVFSGNKLNPKTQAFFTAPVGTMGVPAGQNIPQPITNFALAKVADTLLDINSPVFTPGTGSYIERQQRYIESIQLKKNTNAGAWLRLQSAEKKQSDLATKMDELKPKAKAAFDADTDKPEKMPFRTWVSRNYPNYDSLNSELQQAASARAAAMIEVYGPGAEELTRKRNAVKKARDPDESNPGYNMLVSDQPADTIDGGALDENAIPQYKPVYTMEGYKDAVKQWVANSAADSGTAKPLTIQINTSKSSTESWEDSGFSKSSASVGVRYWFISARSTVNNVEKEEHLSLEQLGAGLSVNLRATGIKAFNVNPGGWDGDFGSLFKDVSLLANFALPPACTVSQIVMGYNVSLDISMSSVAAKQVSDLYSRTTSAGGSISIFGIPIGVGAGHESRKSTGYGIKNNENNFSSFSIAGEDNGYPVVLGVVGRKLPALGKAK